MLKTTKYVGLAAFGMLLQGCVATYVPKPDETMVTVRTVGYGRPQLCKNGEFFWAPEATDVSDGVRVPAGQRLTFGSHISYSGYQVIHYCRPFLSFIPKSGQIYVMNSALDGDGKCTIELVREDASSKNGLAIEYSVDRSNCSVRKSGD